MPDLIRVEGVEQVCAWLDAAPTELMQVALSRGLMAGAEIIERAVGFRAPQREHRVGGDAQYEAMLAGLEVRLTLDSAGRGGLAEIGFWKTAHVAEWVELGHRMVGHDPQIIVRGKRLAKHEFGDSVPPHPFMRPAFDASADDAAEAFVVAVNEAVDQFMRSA